MGSMITFTVISKNGGLPNSAVNQVFLRTDHWNDYSFVTMFQVYAFDERGVRHDLDSVKIGFVGQDISVSTYSTLAHPFTELHRNYFSVGSDVTYYSKLRNEFSEHFRAAYLIGLRDVVAVDEAMSRASTENVFATSLLRTLSMSTIEQQFKRVLAGGTLLTEYDFRFSLNASEKRAGVQLDFKVIPDAKPNTNIHAIIGRNGVGKTTLLNAMINAGTGLPDAEGQFETKYFLSYSSISPDYFSSIISVSFSAFDPFNPPEEQSDPSKGPCYFYVGLKSVADEDGILLKSLKELYLEFYDSLALCFSEAGKKKRWLRSISTLETDDNFAEMELSRLGDVQEEQLKEISFFLLKKMSSGHAIVLLTITKLVARLEEKTLVLFDEPESHLHPPLLAALIRSLSELLVDRNAVAIVATHSPVVLQEVPKSCAWKITRSGISAAWSRPESETFGENVGLLTREVFGLEVSKSGFNALLSAEADKAASYEQALASFDGQLGFEGRAILRSLLHHRGIK
jgi:predicted ATPase